MFDRIRFLIYSLLHWTANRRQVWRLAREVYP
jgi:hypothetical protein